MKTTQSNNSENVQLTKAEQLVEVAKWVKKQNPEFTKNFPSMRSIIRFYLELPKSYDKKKSIITYINKNLTKTHRKFADYIDYKNAERLSLIANSLFGFRYFEKAPYKWCFELGLRRWTFKGTEHIEVVCSPYDRCNLYDNFKPLRHSTRSTPIKTLRDAKRAAEHLLTSETKNKGIDYEVIYSNNLKEAMKQNNPTNEELHVMIDVVI